jgi:hypothetical protein
MAPYSLDPIGYLTSRLYDKPIKAVLAGTALSGAQVKLHRPIATKESRSKRAIRDLSFLQGADISGAVDTFAASFPVCELLFGSRAQYALSVPSQVSSDAPQQTQA